MIFFLTQPLAEWAGDFALRAYDGMQLAASQTRHRAMPSEVTFACADARLGRAAKVLGLAAA